MSNFINDHYSWYEFLDFAENTPSGNLWIDAKQDTSARKEACNWNGYVTYSQALDL